MLSHEGVRGWVAVTSAQSKRERDLRMVFLGGIHSVLGAPSLSSLGIWHTGQGPVLVDNNDLLGTGFLKGSYGFGVSQETVAGPPEMVHLTLLSLPMF